MFTLDRTKIFKIMAAKGLNQSDVAKEAGMQRQMLSFILSGKQDKARISTAGKIAKALGVDVLEIGHI